MLKALKKIINIDLHWQILIALLIGVVYGIFLTQHVIYVKWMGVIFMRALKMIIVPLVLSSITAGVANLGTGDSLGRLGIKTICYYVSTTLLAVLAGLFFVNMFRPGVGADLGLAGMVEGLEAARGSFGSTLINIIPTNIFKAFTAAQMLSIIFFAILFGVFITRVESKYRTMFTDLFNGAFEVMMKITMFIIRFTPLGIIGIVAKVVAEQSARGNLMELVQRLGIYMLCVLLGLLVHSLITLPLLLKFVGRVSPWAHFQALRTPLLTAFSTSSSGCTLPLTMEAVENKSGVSNTVTSFTLPLGATINMDGTALYECVAAMFIAQAYGVELGMLQQVVVVITALLASIGAAAIPMAGLVMITVILSAVGLPLEGVGLILAVDRVLDMCRTTVNVWSDSCGAVVIAKTEGETLKV